MKLENILNRIAQGELSPQQAKILLQTKPYQELADGLNLDLQRQERTGQAEVVFGLGKTFEQLTLAITAILDHHKKVLATKIDPHTGARLCKHFPQGQYWPQACLFSAGKKLALDPPRPKTGHLLIVTAGAADLPVGLEALGTAQFLGMDAGIIPDVGVAGLHRLTPHLPALKGTKLLIVAAGMEGALPSVLAGLLDKPILAVPTSIGYGIGHQGFAALGSMLASCAPGLAVLNIDNGFGAAMLAHRLFLSLTDTP